MFDIEPFGDDIRRKPVNWISGVQGGTLITHSGGTQEIWSATTHCEEEKKWTKESTQKAI